MSATRIHTSEALSFTATFCHYMSINHEPHYLFEANDQKYLVKCSDYPKYIGELSSCDLMNITGEIEEIYKEGTKLINVKWRY